MAERALIGAVAAALLTALARRYGTLDESGQWGAFACGVAASIAGWPWALLLVAYFAAATGVTRFRADKKAEQTLGTNPQVAPRTAPQVLANGGLFCVLAVQAGPNVASVWGLAAVGALAAASADTWATEIGTLWGGQPRSIATWRPTLPGMSGGVTWVGTLAALAGATLVALAAAWLHQIEPTQPFVIAIIVGGFAGSTVDSFLGGTVQTRRWCEHCRAWTERRVHPCSYRTVHTHGYRWFSNDVVNAAATVAGAAATIGAARLLR
ncbi:MAG: DUF92 domain-containing protein [Gemmatimonadetes bacterium]|nr:DUF92 domain-containing protein [Gemmatimonadota bacterium]